MTQRLDIKHISQLKQHHNRHFPISTPIATGMDMDDLFVPKPLHRHIMLSHIGMTNYYTDKTILSA